MDYRYFNLENPHLQQPLPLYNPAYQAPHPVYNPDYAGPVGKLQSGAFGPPGGAPLFFEQPQAAYPIAPLAPRQINQQVTTKVLDQAHRSAQLVLKLYRV